MDDGVVSRHHRSRVVCTMMVGNDMNCAKKKMEKESNRKKGLLSHYLLKHTRILDCLDYVMSLLGNIPHTYSLAGCYYGKLPEN